MKTKTANEPSSQPRRARKRVKSISKKRWLTYAAAGAATVVGGVQSTESADAAINHVDPDPDILVTGSGNPGYFVPYSLDMNGDGIIDFYPAQGQNVAGTVGAAVVFGGTAGAVAGFVANNFVYPDRLASGVSVATQAMVGTYDRGDLAFNGGYTNSQWLPPASTAGADTTGYIGVRFGAADGDHFGWIRATVGNYPLNTLTLHEWAYQTDPGEGILTGQIPEPGSLGLLAVGGAGLLAWRRRKAQAAA